MSAADPTYWQEIRPLLRRHCTACHSARTVQAPEVSGGLALDSYAAARTVAERAASPLLQRLLTNDAEQRMPLSAPPLAPERIALIRRWVESGAKEGSRPAEEDAAGVARTLHRAPKLDIILPISAKGRAKKLELALRVGPLAPATAVAFSPDGTHLAVGCYGHVTIWDLETVQPVQVFTNVLGAVNDVRFSPDGALLAVAGGQPSAKGDLRLYRVRDGKLLAVLGGHTDVVFSVAFHPDGQHLASASFDKTVRLWRLDAKDGTAPSLERILTAHSDCVCAVAFGPDGKWLVSASTDRSVKLVETATAKSRFTFSGTDQGILAVAVRPDGKAVVFSGLDPRLFWWDPQNGERIRVQKGHGVGVHELCFSADGRLLASAGADETIKLWDGMTGALQRTLPVGSVAYAVAIRPDGKRVAAGGFDGLVRLWDTSSGRLLVRLLDLPPDGQRHEWAAVTPEGYLSGSPTLAERGQWHMDRGSVISADMIWKTLRRPEILVQATHGQRLPPLSWEGERGPISKERKKSR